MVCNAAACSLRQSCDGRFALFNRSMQIMYDSSKLYAIAIASEGG